VTAGGAGPGPPAGLAYGVDVGGTKVLGVALDRAGSVVAEARVTTPHTAIGPAGPERGSAGGEVADAVAEVVRRLDEAAPGAPDARPVGVGVPGMLDPHGVLRFSPNLPGAIGADMRALVSERLVSERLGSGGLGSGGLGSDRLGAGGAGTGGAGGGGAGGRPVVVGNDANCAALAELRSGAARGAEEALVVTLGTGIGGGLIAGGRVRTGAHGFAGEIGHMVVDPSGPPCTCGGRGCWERYASGGGLGRLAREAAFAGSLHQAVVLAGGDPELVRGEHVTLAALAGDPGALAVVEELGWWVALGLSNLVAVCDPERIVLGGGVAEVGDLLLAPTRRAFATLLEGGRERPAISIVPAQLGERAGAVGAALLAREGGLR
jgi:glucokinase